MVLQIDPIRVIIIHIGQIIVQLDFSYSVNFLIHIGV